MKSKTTLIVAIGLLAFAAAVRGGELEAPTTFTGQKATWHGFDRYDFVMDNADFNIKPFQPPAEEGAGVGSPPAGQRR